MHYIQWGRSLDPKIKDWIDGKKSRKTYKHIREKYRNIELY